MTPERQRLLQQLNFLREIDKVKAIVRKTSLFDGSRRENDAEHSWTLAVMVSLLREYADVEVKLERTLLMVLLHDVVEVDAGDVFIYDPARAHVAAKEEAAAQRIYGLLPADQAQPWLELWREFEARQTPEAKFAAAFDRLEPVLQNYYNGGGTWREFGITKAQVVAKNQPIADASQRLWAFVQELIEECDQRGDFA
ncbi:MAG: HD domain-containing protein [Spirochaetales bacterium]